MTKVPFDVTGVLPFPMRDPHADDIRPASNGVPRKAPDLPLEQEQYRLYTVDELGRLPPVSWLIDDYLAVGELTVLYGKGATYKSFLALAWAARLAHAGHSVVYIVAEGASGMRARIPAWQKHNDVPELPTLYLMPANVNLHEEDRVAVWLEAMNSQMEHTPSLVVVDTLARNFVGGSENNPMEMGLFVDGLERIRRELETAVLVIHHTTKEGDTERGTESLRNASFAMYKMDRVNNSRTVAVKCDRMKEAEHPPKISLHLQSVALPELGDGVDSLVADWPFSPQKRHEAKAADEAQNEAKISPQQRRVLGKVYEAKDEANAAALAKAFGVRRNNLSRTLKPLLEGGFLRSEGQSRLLRYVITERGRDAL